MIAYWPPKASRRHHVSGDQSVRSASLTSIVEMYHRPMRSCSTLQRPSASGSFYYDYTEDFEVATLREPDAAVPFEPISQRTESTGLPDTPVENSMEALTDNGQPPAQSLEATPNSGMSRNAGSES